MAINNPDDPDYDPSYTRGQTGQQTLTPGNPAPPQPADGTSPFTNIVKNPVGVQTPVGQTPEYLQYLASTQTPDPTGAAWVYNRNTNAQPGSQAVYYPGTDTLGLPSAYLADDKGAWNINPRGPEGGTNGGTMGGSISPPPSIGASLFAAGDQQRQAQAEQLFQYLMGRAHQSENVTADDPVIKGQTDAYASRQIDSSRNELSALAERGGANFNPEASQRSVAERLGKNTADFQSQLMGRELQSRRDEITNSLTQMAGLLTAEQQMALQDELARLEMMSGQSQFGQSLAERAFEFGATNNP